MDSVLYIWLGTAAIAPFVTLLSTWTLVVFFSYRRRWRLSDVFLCSLTAHEVVFSLFGFGFAVLSIIRPLLDTPCSFIIWGLSASRIFHLSAVTSLLLDRALSSKFPYTYRYSVRKSQVQYHLAVLGIISVFVGVTAVFARAPPAVEGLCSVHPLAWNSKFSMFMASVYGMLLVTGFACCLTVVVVGRRSPEGKYSSAPVNWESGRSSSSSNSSKAPKDNQRDGEWRTVAAVCCLSYIVNHVPFLVLTVMGIVEPTFWTPWMDNVTVWISLAQGILVPMLLLAADLPHRSAVKNMLRQPGRIYRHLSDTSGFLMQVADAQCPKTGGPPPPTMMRYQSKCIPTHNIFHVPQRIRWTPNTLPSLQSLNLDKRQSSAFSSSSGDSKGSSRCLSPVPPSARDIYCSLDSSCYTLLSLRSCSSRLSSTISLASKIPSDEDTVSITTNALDDFEYHGGEKGGCDQQQQQQKMFNDIKSEILQDQCIRRNDISDTAEHSPVAKQNEKGLCENSEPNSCNRSFFRNSEASVTTREDLCSSETKTKVFTARNIGQYIPDFSNNNLVFLSTKPLQTCYLSMGAGKEPVNAVAERVEPSPSQELWSSKSSHRPVKAEGSVMSEPEIPSPVSISNGSAFTCTDSSLSEQRLIIYSEYL